MFNLFIQNNKARTGDENKTTKYGFQPDAD